MSETVISPPTPEHQTRNARELAYGVAVCDASILKLEEAITELEAEIDELRFEISGYEQDREDSALQLLLYGLEHR